VWAGAKKEKGKCLENKKSAVIILFLLTIIQKYVLICSQSVVEVSRSLSVIKGKGKEETHRTLEMLRYLSCGECDHGWILEIQPEKTGMLVWGF
jgi:hypothetical protein